MTRTRTGKTTDRRVARTHSALHDALIALILERGWDHTSVQNICDRANIGRSTFYAHFESKEKLLVSGLDELHQMLRQQTARTGEVRTTAFGFLRGLIEHVHENQRLFRAVVGKRSGLVVQRHFRQLLVDLVAEDLAGAGLPANRRGAATHYIAGALFELLTWWVDSRRPLTPRELETTFREFTRPVVNVLRRVA